MKKKSKEIPPAIDDSSIRKEFENIEGNMRKRVKDILAAKDCAVKTSASGVALSKLLEAMDDATGEQIFAELRKMRLQSLQCAQAYRKYAERIPDMLTHIDALKEEMHQLSNRRDALLRIPDETIRNAVELYCSIVGTYNARMRDDTDTAKEITIAYLQSHNVSADAIAEVETEANALAAQKDGLDKARKEN